MKLSINKLNNSPSRNYLVLLATTALAVASAGFAMSYFLTKSDTTGINRSQVCEVATCVALKADQADPDTITVAVGSEVQFNSADGKSHKLSLGRGGEEHSHKGKFNSDTFMADEAWRVRFDADGTYFFHDHLNPKINILVVVYTPGKPYTVN